MSPPLINRSPDLCKLRDEGYDIAVVAGYLLLRQVPYLNSKMQVSSGTLVSELTLAGDVTAKPKTHVAYFVGDFPCNIDGSEIAKIKNQSSRIALAPGLAIDHTFSSKPPSGYADHYDKMRTYFAIISTPARSIDPDLKVAVPVVVVDAESQDNPFNYIDTASASANINMVSERLKVGSIAIVGLGGTGSYVLDLVSKTPVPAIHLFDGGTLLQRNAFRCPGAPSIEELRTKPTKVDYFQAIYSKMHRGIYAHPEYVDENNAHLLASMAFVFICVDNGQTRRIIIEALESSGVPFIDVGMGVYASNGALGGILRVTTSTPEHRDHVAHRVPFSDFDADDEYGSNIQISDLNAFNAILAVNRWKRLLGFYVDFEHEYSSTYTIDGNKLINEDRHAPERTDGAQIRRSNPR